MQGLITAIDGISGFLAIFGFSLSAIFVAYAGILLITSGGDPNKVAQARGAFLTVIVGTIVAGVSFLLPGVVSRMVIEPPGGVGIQEAVSRSDCDGLLRRALVAQRNANTAHRMNLLITEIQGQFPDCVPDLWAPEVDDSQTVTSWSSCGQQGQGLITVTGTPPLGGFSQTRYTTIRGLQFPLGLTRAGLYGGHNSPLDFVHRDGLNNILVYFKVKPSDQSNCWVYFSSFDTWRSS